MFDYSCGLLAIIFCLLSFDECRKISLIILCEFLAHDIAVLLMPDAISAEYGYPIFLAYATINLSALYLIKRYKPHFFITLLLLINLGYNMLIVWAYSTTGWGVFHANFTPVARVIMIFELAYMMFIGRAYAMLHYKLTKSSDPYIDRLFCSGAIYSNRRIL
jgi:hypothetical protein